MRIAAFFFFVVLSATHAHANILVSPTRVVLSDKEREAEIIVSNQTDKTAVYRIAFENYLVAVDGSYSLAPTTGSLNTSERMVRYTPRQVELPPRGKQVVRLRLRLPADLPPGEYRSHLRFGTVLREPPRPTTNATRKVSFGVKINYGMSIPVLVRHLTTPARAEITEAKFEPDSLASVNDKVAIYFERRGDESTYGKVDVYFQSPGMTERTLVGAIDGLALHVPNRDRVVRIPVKLPEGVKAGTFTVIYTDTEHDLGILAQKNFTLR